MKSVSLRQLHMLTVLAALTIVAAACAGNDPMEEASTPTEVSPLSTLLPGSIEPAMASPTALPTPTASSVRPFGSPTSVNPLPTLPPRPTRVVPTRAIPTPSPTPTPAPTPVPSEETFIIYGAGQFTEGFSALSLDTPSPDPSYDGRLYLGQPTLLKNLYLIENGGEFMSVFSGGQVDLSPYTHVRFVANSVSARGAWMSVSLAIQPWEEGANSVQVFVPPGQWTTFSIPISDMDTFRIESGVRGIGFKGEIGPSENNDNAVAFGEISLVRISDREPPELVGLNDAAGHLLNLEFSEPTTGLSSDSFMVTSTSDPAYAAGHVPASAEAYESGRFVQLRLDPPLQDGIEYTVTVTGVTDASGNLAPAASHTLVPGARSVTLTVDATEDVNPFTPKIRGLTMQTTSWIWAGIVDPGSAKRAALLGAASRIKPGIIRFAGGPWINSTGWDRDNQAPVDGDWSTTASGSGARVDYRHAYKPEMIDSYAAFAAELGAESIIQVNICDGNPDMWADLVLYANVEHDYDFLYWELGDRMDQHECLSVFEYAERFAQYSVAMKAVDPGIKIIGPTPTQPQRIRWLESLSTHPLAQPDALSFQWYQLLDWTDNKNSFAYETGSVDALLNYNTEAGDGCWVGFGCDSDTGEIDPEELDRIVFRRGIAEAMSDALKDIPGNAETAITEFGAHGSQRENPVNGNHIGALWLADMMTRWAYNGIDILIFNGMESGSSEKGHATGVLGIDGFDTIDVRPTYYTQWLYANFFGDTLVSSSTSDESQQVIVWASRDSSDPNVLKLMLINLSGDRAKTTVSVSGFIPTSGEAHIMTSTASTSMSNPASFAEHETSINGFVIPDVSVASPQDFTDAIDAITPVQIGVGSQFRYELQPYSLTALTLTR